MTDSARTINSLSARDAVVTEVKCSFGVISSRALLVVGAGHLWAFSRVETLQEGPASPST